MKKVLLLCGLLVALTATVASAAQGVNLRWNACFGDLGTANRNSTCLANSGTNALVGSFEVGSDILGVTGIEVVVDLVTASPTLPAWWAFGAGGCRAGSLSANPTISPLAANCFDWANGLAAGGLAAYQVGGGGPNTARIIIGFAVAAPNDVLGRRSTSAPISSSAMRRRSERARARAASRQAVSCSTRAMLFPAPTRARRLSVRRMARTATSRRGRVAVASARAAARAALRPRRPAIRPGAR